MSVSSWRAGLCVVIVSSSWPRRDVRARELSRQPVSGYVKLDGKPLAKGVIIFYPVKGIGSDS